MKLMIQDPSYVNGMRLGEALIDACKKSNDGAGAFAFVEENGIDLFLGDSDFIKFIKTHSFELVVGTDSITDPKAITKLRILRCFLKKPSKAEPKRAQRLVPKRHINAIMNTKTITEPMDS